MLRDFCGISAGFLREFCGISAGVLREFCGISEKEIGGGKTDAKNVEKMWKFLFYKFFKIFFKKVKGTKGGQLRKK